MRPEFDITTNCCKSLAMLLPLAEKNKNLRLYLQSDDAMENMLLHVRQFFDTESEYQEYVAESRADRLAVRTSDEECQKLFEYYSDETEDPELEAMLNIIANMPRA